MNEDLPKEDSKETRPRWICLATSLLSWEWFTDANMVQLWVYLLISANWKETRWRGVKIERGQLLTGRNKISEDTGMSHKSIRTCLIRLKSANQVAIKTTSRYSIITILNYEKYQGRDFSEGPADRPTDRPARGQQRASKGPHPTISTIIPDLQEEVRSSPSPTEQSLGIPSKPSRPEIIKGEYGAYRHVHLSDSEYSDWKSRVGPVILERMIEKLDSWVEQERENPKIFKKRQGNGRNAAACFRSWVHRAVCEERQSSRKFGGGSAMDADASERARLRNKQSMQQYKQQLTQTEEDSYAKIIGFTKD